MFIYRIFTKHEGLFNLPGRKMESLFLSFSSGKTLGDKEMLRRDILLPNLLKGLSSIVSSIERCPASGANTPPGHHVWRLLYFAFVG